MGAYVEGDKLMETNGIPVTLKDNETAYGCSGVCVRHCRSNYNSISIFKVKNKV